jgi:DNA topoisomerase-1
MEKRAFVTTATGFAVNDYLLQFFPHIMDIQFTARVEEHLDEIEEGQVEWVQFLREYYDDLRQYLATAEANAPQYLEDQTCPECGGRLLVRFSVRGKFAGCETYPKCEYTIDLSPEVQRNSAEPVGRDCPECGAPLVTRAGFRGRPFIACSAYPKCTYKEQVGADGESKPASKAIQTGVACDRCGAPMLLRDSRRGQFLGCSAFPKCRNIRQIARLEQAEDGAITALEPAEPKAAAPRATRRKAPAGADAAAATAAADDSEATTDDDSGATTTTANPADAVPGLICDMCGAPMVVRRGKRGPFVACSAYPRCKNAKPMKVAYEAGYARPEVQELEEQCPECDKVLLVRQGRKGKFVGCSGYPKCKYTRDLTAEEQ